MSLQVRVSDVHRIINMFKFGASARSEVTQQMFQGIPILLDTCWVFALLFHGVGSPRFIKVRPAKFMRPNQTTIWPCKGMALHCSDMSEK